MGSEMCIRDSIQAAADLARVDDDDLAGAACLGVTVQVDLEPTVLKGGVVRHVRVLLHKLEQLLSLIHI